MWVHSLWSLVPGGVGELVKYLSDDVLQNAEHQELQGGTLLRQRGTFAELPKDDAWVQAPTAETIELAGVYVLSPTEYGLQSASGRTLVGAVSPRPASNYALVERALTTVSRYTDYRPENVLPLLPILSKDALLHLDGMTLYEARTEQESREVSVTYFDPKSPGVLDEWPDDSTEFAAATVNWQNHLLTVFTDGQVWLEGVTPEEVPSAIGAVSINLWGRIRIPDVVA